MPVSILARLHFIWSVLSLSLNLFLCPFLPSALHADMEDFMSSAGINTPADRDFNAGYKHDAGWIPDARVATVATDSLSAATAAAPSALLTELRGGVITTSVAAIDGGSLARGSDSPPLALRLRHPGSRTDTGERWWYASFRAQSQSSPRGVTINDVPLDSGTAGNSRLWDSTGVTPSQADAGLSVGAAAVLPSVGGSEYLWEAVGYGRSPAASTNPLDGRLSLRISKIDSLTRLTPAGLGCWGTACAPAPTATPIIVNCGANPSAAVAVAVPVTELGYPTVFSLSDSSLSATTPALAASGVSALLCLAPGTTAASVNASLAGYDAFPTAEALTTSSLTRGNAYYSASAFNTSCWSLSFALPAGGSKFIAAAARSPRGGVVPWASPASAPAPLTLTLSCAAPVAGASPTPLGPILSVFSTACVFLDFAGSSNAQFDGTYCRNTAVGMVSGTWQYDDSDGRYQLTWQSSSWFLWVWGSRSSYYFSQAVSYACTMFFSVPAHCSCCACQILLRKGTMPHARLHIIFPSSHCSLQDAGKTDLPLLTVFGPVSLASSRLCPTGSVFYSGAQAGSSGGGCVSCPLRASVRGGAAAATIPDVTAACFCEPGFYSVVDVATNRSSCSPCAAGTYKEYAGNAASSCIACPAGFTSAAGATTCVPSAGALGTTPATPSSGTAARAVVSPFAYASCASGSLNITGFTSSFNGPYALSPADGPAGHGQLAYRLTTAAAPSERWLVFSAADSLWTFASNSAGNPFFTRVTTLRPMHLWTSSEWTAAGYPSAKAACTCMASENASATGCTCPAGQAPAPGTGVCTPSAAIGAAPSQLPAGSCLSGWGLDAATRSMCVQCADGETVDAAAGTCRACPTAGLTRGAAVGSCGCPHGSVVSSAGACTRPSDVWIDIPSAAASSSSATVALTAASPIRGRYVACSAAGMPVGFAAWQLVEALSGASTPAQQLFLVYWPPGTAGAVAAAALLSSGAAGAPAAASSGVWAIQAGSVQATTGSNSMPTPRYAYVSASDLSIDGAWPASISFGVSSVPSTVATAPTAMLPAGLQSNWQAFFPWPVSFAATALQVNASLTAAAGDSTPPSCGSVTLANAASAAGPEGASTLGGGSAVYAPSPTASPLPPGVSPSNTATPTVTPSPLPPGVSPSNSASISPSVLASPSMAPSVISGSATRSASAIPTGAASSQAPATSPSAAPLGASSSPGTRGPSVSRSVAASASPTSTPRAIGAVSVDVSFAMNLALSQVQADAFQAAAAAARNASSAAIGSSSSSAIASMLAAVLSVLGRALAAAMVGRFPPPSPSSAVSLQSVAAWGYPAGSSSGSGSRVLQQQAQPCNPLSAAAQAAGACALAGANLTLAIRDVLPPSNVLSDVAVLALYSQWAAAARSGGAVLQSALTSQLGSAGAAAFVSADVQDAGLALALASSLAGSSTLAPTADAPSGSAAVSLTGPPATSTGGSKSSSAAIGGAIGGVAFVGIIAAVVLIALRRRRAATRGAVADYRRAARAQKARQNNSGAAGSDASSAVDARVDAAQTTENPALRMQGKLPASPGRNAANGNGGASGGSSPRKAGGGGNAASGHSTPLPSSFAAGGAAGASSSVTVEMVGFAAGPAARGAVSSSGGSSRQLGMGLTTASPGGSSRNLAAAAAAAGAAVAGSGSSRRLGAASHSPGVSGGSGSSRRLVGSAAAAAAGVAPHQSGGSIRNMVGSPVSGGGSGGSNRNLTGSPAGGSAGSSRRLGSGATGATGGAGGSRRHLSGVAPQLTHMPMTPSAPATGGEDGDDYSIAAAAAEAAAAAMAGMMAVRASPAGAARGSATSGTGSGTSGAGGGGLYPVSSFTTGPATALRGDESSAAASGPASAVGAGGLASHARTPAGRKSMASYRNMPAVGGTSTVRPVRPSMAPPLPGSS